MPLGTPVTSVLYVLAVAVPVALVMYFTSRRTGPQGAGRSGGGRGGIGGYRSRYSDDDADKENESQQQQRAAMDQGDGDETLRRRKRREDTERGKCPACLDQMTELADRGYTVYALDCGHIICGQCLQGLQSSINFTCPLCRTSISEPRELFM